MVQLFLSQYSLDINLHPFLTFVSHLSAGTAGLPLRETRAFVMINVNCCLPGILDSSRSCTPVQLGLFLSQVKQWGGYIVCCVEVFQHGKATSTSVYSF